MNSLKNHNFYILNQFFFLNFVFEICSTKLQNKTFFLPPLKKKKKLDYLQEKTSVIWHIFSNHSYLHHRKIIES